MDEPTICPRCERRMGLDWMGDPQYSVHDGKTIVCDVCSDAEALEAGEYRNDLASMLMSSGSDKPAAFHGPYTGKPYWTTA